MPGASSRPVMDRINDRHSMFTSLLPPVLPPHVRQSRKLQHFLISRQIILISRPDQYQHFTFGMFSGASAIESKPCPVKESPALPAIWRLSSSVMGLLSPVSELLSDPARPFLLRTVLTTQATRPATGMTAITPTTYIAVLAMSSCPPSASLLTDLELLALPSAC